jgi:hypothetical protein
MPSSAAVFGEPLGDVDPHALLDVMEDLLVAALIADQQEPDDRYDEALLKSARSSARSLPCKSCGDHQHLLADTTLTSGLAIWRASSL